QPQGPNPLSNYFVHAFLVTVFVPVLLDVLAACVEPSIRFELQANPKPISPHTTVPITWMPQNFVQAQRSKAKRLQVQKTLFERLQLLWAASRMRVRIPMQSLQNWKNSEDMKEA